MNIDLQTVYKQSEYRITILITGLVLLLVGFIFLQSYVSAGMVMAIVLSLGFFSLALLRPHWALAALTVYLPFESLILKFTPNDVYLFARYASEGLIYVIAGVAVVHWLIGKIRIRQTPVDLPFALFLVVLLASSIINFVNPMDAALGIRQIIRFILVFFLVVQLAPSKTFIKRLTYVMFAIVGFQAVLGLVQSVIGAPLDQFLLPSEERTFGSIVLKEGVEQFWDPGSRVFATLGRYDRLGNFLYIFLLIAVGFLYQAKALKHHTRLLWLFALGIPALILTFSRSSWFAFLFGFLFIGIVLYRDKRVMIALLTFVIAMTSYLGLTGLNVRFITEAPGQTLAERFFETFSYARWRGEYYGLGRVYWFVQTPLTVVPASPLFGFGPSQFGGGAASALVNTGVYEQLGLPFGVFGTEGFIDNNWFSLWGESGTLGMIFYLWMYIGLFAYFVKTARTHPDPYVRGMAAGMTGVMVGMAFNGFTSTLLEIRTSAYYLWLYAGFVFILSQPAQKKRLKNV